jgi:haloacetate dehalogenase
MGRDVVRVMEELGHVHFAVAGHDRGARVGYRLALDHPGRVERLALSTSCRPSSLGADPRRRIPAPTGVLSPSPTRAETEIGRDPLPYFEGLHRQVDGRRHASTPSTRGRSTLPQSCNEPTRIHAFCEDYRAGAGADREADEADLAAGATSLARVHVIWGAFYLTRAAGDARTTLDVWRETFAPQATGTEVRAGHFVAEEDPEGTLDALQGFLGASAA